MRDEHSAFLRLHVVALLRCRPEKGGNNTQDLLTGTSDPAVRPEGTVCRSWPAARLTFGTFLSFEEVAASEDAAEVASSAFALPGGWRGALSMS